MLRKIAIWMLLAPMLLNGLWMVCSDHSSETTAAATGSPQHSEEECARICMMKVAGEQGTICFALPGNAKTSITVLDFGVAVLPLEFRFQPAVSEESFAAGRSAVYTTPSLNNLTPPPKA